MQKYLFILNTELCSTLPLEKINWIYDRKNLKMCLCVTFFWHILRNTWFLCNCFCRVCLSLLSQQNTVWVALQWVFTVYSPTIYVCVCGHLCSLVTLNRSLDSSECQGKFVGYHAPSVHFLISWNMTRRMQTYRIWHTVQCNETQWNVRIITIRIY